MTDNAKPEASDAAKQGARIATWLFGLFAAWFIISCTVQITISAFSAEDSAPSKLP